MLVYNSNHLGFGLLVGSLTFSSVNTEDRIHVFFFCFAQIQNLSNYPRCILIEVFCALFFGLLIKTSFHILSGSDQRTASANIPRD